MVMHGSSIHDAYMQMHIHISCLDGFKRVCMISQFSSNFCGLRRMFLLRGISFFLMIVLSLCGVSIVYHQPRKKKCETETRKKQKSLYMVVSIRLKRPTTTTTTTTMIMMMMIINGQIANGQVYPGVVGVLRSDRCKRSTYM